MVNVKYKNLQGDIITMTFKTDDEALGFVNGFQTAASLVSADGCYCDFEEDFEE